MAGYGPSRGLKGGDVGERWRNLTGQVWFQWVSSLRVPCKVCLPRHGRIFPEIPERPHPNCECDFVPVQPGDLSPLPVSDPPEVLGRIDRAALPGLVGADVAELLRAGLVDEDDVVDADWRFASAAELVRRMGIT